MAVRERDLSKLTIELPLFSDDHGPSKPVEMHVNVVW